MAAVDAGLENVIIPRENEKEVKNLPEYIRDKVNNHFVIGTQDVLEFAVI